jgi:hypothetical protein
MPTNNFDMNLIATRILRQALHRERLATKHRKPLVPLAQWLRDHPPSRRAAKAPRQAWEGSNRLRPLSPAQLAQIGRIDGPLDPPDGTIES